jgi:hypothetical protein
MASSSNDPDNKRSSGTHTRVNQRTIILDTGDISQLSKPLEFDTVDQILQSAPTKDVFFVPGEHDVLEDDGKQYFERYGKNTKGAG